MPLAFKPHTVTVRRASQSLVGENPQAKGDGQAFTIRCQVDDDTPDAAIRDFGIELRRPMRLLCDAADAYDANGKDIFEVGNEVDWVYQGRTRTLEVATPPILSQMGLAADHAEVLLKDPQFN